MTPPKTAPRGGGSLAGALATRRQRPAPRAYDFRRPTQLSREHVRHLQIALETFARQSTTTLTGLLRTGARLDYASIEQVPYDEYVASLPSLTFIATFGLDPLPGTGSLAFDLDSAMASVDHMVGGPGSKSQPSRQMTSMESVLIRHLLEKLLRELGYSFETLAAVEPVLKGLEYNPQLAQTAAASETVVIGRFTLRIGLRETQATLCLPFSSLAPALNAVTSPQLSERDKAKREAAQAAVIERLTQVPVEVSVRFSPVTLPTADLVNLAVGDVVRLRHPQDAPLEVTAADETFAHAVHGSHRRRLVASIVSTSTTDQKDG